MLLRYIRLKASWAAGASPSPPRQVLAHAGSAASTAPCAREVRPSLGERAGLAAAQQGPRHQQLHEALDAAQGGRGERERAALKGAHVGLAEGACALDSKGDAPSCTAQAQGEARGARQWQGLALSLDELD
jgi:hypothetical protein